MLFAKCHPFYSSLSALILLAETESWWRHQMETFSALLAIYAGNSLVPGEFPSQRTVTRSFDVFFDLHLNKELSKQSWGWWFETVSGSLWRQCNDIWEKLGQYHVCWCPGSLCHQFIGNHVIDYAWQTGPCNPQKRFQVPVLSYCEKIDSKY